MILLLYGILHRISAAFGCIGLGTRAAKRFVPAIALLSAGCSIHPTQFEVTGVPTHILVDYIRCETRLAIQDKALDLLRIENFENPVIAKLAPRRGLTWPPYVRSWMTPQERIIYDKYIETGIAFDFTFDITENNAVAGVADPVKLITNGVAGVGLSAGGTYNRNNARHFIVSETASNLLQNDKLGYQGDCGDYRAPNFIYPISGNIGMKELISTFFDLNEVKELTADKTSVFADTLTFTTTHSGGATPHVFIEPVGTRWGLAAPTNVTGSVSRIDKHMLIIGLSRDKPKSVPAHVAGAAAVVPGYAAGRSALQRNVVRSQEEQSALDAVRQQRLDSYLDRAVR